MTITGTPREASSAVLYPADSELPLLDVLRAVGAVCVLTTHTAFWAGDYFRNGALGTFLARLDVGVAVFFVLSGFLLSRPWLARAADGQAPPSVRGYFWKRLLRIVPLYVIVAVFALALVDGNRDLGPRQWLSTLLLLDPYHQARFPDGLTHMWSLTAEVAFYVVLPLLMAAMVGRRGTLPVARVLVGVAAMGTVAVWWLVSGATWASGASDGITLQWLPAYLTWFGAGIALALAHVLHTRGRAARPLAPLLALAGQPGSCWALVLGLLLVAATPVAGPSVFAAASPAESVTKNLLYTAIATLVVLTAVFPHRGSTYHRVAGHRWGRRLGWISYGLFCVHLPLLHFVMWGTGWSLFEGRGVLIWAMTLVLSIAVAEVAYRVIERPFQRLKGLVGKTPPRTATATATRDTTIT